MKVMVVRSPAGLDNVVAEDRPDPGLPGPGEVRVAVHGSSLNFHDFLVAAGQFPSADGRVLLSDAGGIVEAVGPGVAEFEPGDRVVSCFFPNWPDGGARTDVGSFKFVPGDGVDGFAAAYVVRPAAAFTHAPKGWSHAEAATITTAGLTAWRALVADGGLKAGDTVMTLGTGGVSIAALQIAKMMGARVIVTSSSDEKLERVKALGADAVINYRTHPDWGVLARDMTNGQGVDHVIELGGPGTLAQSIEAVRVGGHISLIGVLTGLSGDIPTANLMVKQVRLQGLIVGSRRQQQDYVAALDAAKVKPVVDRTFGLPQLVEAFRHLQSGQHFGKICLDW